ncbi:Aldehyde dehydrogenase domain [Dillenia turbinata]|uniref:Aldehyde dehydrogenase domain n=1 Tax=Dillenia turbinata TaxID=194707 RepID=A0AAN8ZHQ2_9MAGN
MEEHCNGNSEAYAKIPKIKFSKLFINGEFVDSVSGKKFETIDPRSGEVIAEVAAGDKEDVDLAVKAARFAFDHGPWPRMSGGERRKIMMKLANLIEENLEELAALETIDAGKLFKWCKIIDIPNSIDLLQYYAGAADKIHGSTLKMCNGQYQSYTLREPVGVVGHIIPWNFPSIMFFMKTAPALAAGCAMIVKPAEQTPLSALYYAYLAKQAGIPDGVLNVVPGYGATAGAALCSHMNVDMISFTGSTETGRKVLRAAADSNLKIGEICMAGSRVFVQEGIYDKLVEKLSVMANHWVVGDPFDPSAQQGPQAHKGQYEKVLTYIEHGKREGATLLAGGKPIGEKGYYVQPTIFIDVKDDMRIAKEEIFGPVMSLMKFKTIEEAIERANSTQYGLAAGIVTNSLNIANTVSRSVRAGIVWINCYFTLDPDCPYGGYKMSGYGRDQGLEAVDKYLQTKSVVTPVYNSPWLILISS